MHKNEASASDQISLKLESQDGSKNFFFENLKMECNMHFQLYDENGNLKDERFAHNAVTTAGKNAIADQILASPSLAKMGWMAIGTGSPGATLLGAEVARVAFDSKTRGGNNIVTVVATFGAGVGTGTITEAGTFDVVTANTVNMWMSASFGAITKAAGDSLVVTWTLTIN
jgi:hypothetical protein